MRRKTCMFCKKEIKEIDYRDPNLRSFLTERGKIIPAKVSGLCSKHQRSLTRAIKRARIASLLPFVIK